MSCAFCKRSSCLKGTRKMMTFSSIRTNHTEAGMRIVYLVTPATKCSIKATYSLDGLPQVWKISTSQLLRKLLVSLIHHCRMLDIPGVRFCTADCPCDLMLANIFVCAMEKCYVDDWLKQVTPVCYTLNIFTILFVYLVAEMTWTSFSSKSTVFTLILIHF